MIISLFEIQEEQTCLLTFYLLQVTGEELEEDVDYVEEGARLVCALACSTFQLINYEMGYLVEIRFVSHFALLF